MDMGGEMIVSVCVSGDLSRDMVWSGLSVCLSLLNLENLIAVSFVSSCNSFCPRDQRPKMRRNLNFGYLNTSDNEFFLKEIMIKCKKTDYCNISTKWCPLNELLNKVLKFLGFWKASTQLDRLIERNVTIIKVQTVLTHPCLFVGIKLFVP